MQIQRVDATELDINGASALIDNLTHNDFPHDWSWALHQVQKGLEDGRTTAKPNGGYVVNEMEQDDPFIKRITHFLKQFDKEKVVRMQMYVATTIHSVLFSEHNDPGQRSIIVQGAGRSAVVVGEQATILEHGDILFLNGDETHRFTNLGPRFSITISLEDE